MTRVDIAAFATIIADERKMQQITRLYELGSNKATYITGGVYTLIDSNNVEYFVDQNNIAQVIPSKPVTVTTIKPPTEDMDYISTYDSMKNSYMTGTSYKKPNQMVNNNPATATDKKYDNKVAFSSKTLMDRQQNLSTYSVEVEMLFTAVIETMSKIMQKDLELADIEFGANFGSPIINNAQIISINVTKPIGQQMYVTRKLIQGKLEWSVSLNARGSREALQYDIPVEQPKAKTPVLEHVKNKRKLTIE